MKQKARLCWIDATPSLKFATKLCGRRRNPPRRSSQVMKKGETEPPGSTQSSDLTSSAHESTLVEFRDWLVEFSAYYYVSNMQYDDLRSQQGLFIPGAYSISLPPKVVILKLQIT